MNSRAHEIFTHLFTRSPFWNHRSGIEQLSARSALVLHEHTCVSATRLVLMAVILNSIEASGQISNGRALKMYS